MKVAELSGALLDYWVAKAEGTEPLLRQEGVADEHGIPDSTFVLLLGPIWYGSFEPSSKWMQGGPIIHREGIQVAPFADAQNPDDIGWIAGKSTITGGWEDYTHEQVGDTPLEAAMRCYVASKFGDEVDDAD